MMKTDAVSLRRTLVVQLIALAAVLAFGLYLAVLYSAQRASEATQDAMLGAATTAIAEALRTEDGDIAVNLPPGTLSMLSAMGEERLFYSVTMAGEILTGYADLPMLDEVASPLTPSFYSADYRDTTLRLAAVSRSLLIENRMVLVQVVVGQTRDGQRQIAGQLAQGAAGLGLVAFLIGVPFSLLMAGSLLRPIQRLADAVSRRGAHDLRPVRQSAPSELAPLIAALNGFIARLKGTLHNTETFLAEAAHHIRTPLATLKSEAELSLCLSENEEQRQRLRGMIRTVDECARSAGQLLDHATVLYRADHRESTEVDVGALVSAVAERFTTTAEMRDMRIDVTVPMDPLSVRGDAVLIEAALRNLIDNAIKYSPPDTVVRVRLKGADGKATVRISDEGRGLRGARKADLIRRFRRGNNADGVVGAGLGLTIVQEVVDVMGGTFDIQDIEGGGTCATLSLPAF